MLQNQEGIFTIEEKDLVEAEADVDLTGVTDETQKTLLRTEIAKKRAWREKAVDPESKKSYKELFETLRTQKPPDTIVDKKEIDKETPDDIRKDINSLKEESQKRVFQHANKLTPTQVDEVFGYAKGMGIEPKAALEKPFIQKIITQMTDEEEAQNASLPPSRRAPVQVGGKSFADMTPVERKAAFSSIAARR